MEVEQFSKEVETLFYALQAESGLQSIPVRGGEIAPTDGEKKAYLFEVGDQRFVVALSLQNKPYYTTNINVTR